MKIVIKKNIYILHNEIDEATKKLILNTPKKCSIFKINNQELFFKNKKVELCFLKLNITEKLCNEIINLVYNSHKEVPKIKTSEKFEGQQYGVKTKGKIEGIVNGLFQKICYCSSEYDDIFDIVSILLFRLTKAHAFHNGNKRTALLSISRILKMFGFYISWSSNNQKYIAN